VRAPSDPIEELQELPCVADVSIHFCGDVGSVPRVPIPHEYIAIDEEVRGARASEDDRRSTAIVFASGRGPSKRAIACASRSRLPMITTSSRGGSTPRLFGRCLSAEALQRSVGLLITAYAGANRTSPFHPEGAGLHMELTATAASGIGDLSTVRSRPAAALFDSYPRPFWHGH
jgi:hypothetical protein